jgi:hypothetical protein
MLKQVQNKFQNLKCLYYIYGVITCAPLVPIFPKLKLPLELEGFTDICQTNKNLDLTYSPFTSFLSSLQFLN